MKKRIFVFCITVAMITAALGEAYVPVNAAEDEEIITDEVCAEYSEMDYVTEDSSEPSYEVFPEPLESGTDITSYVEVNKDGYLTKYTGTDISDIIIPSSVNGVTVIGIGNDAFKDHSEIVSVSIPSTVTNIGSYAFSGVGFGTKNSYGSVTIPATVKRIEHFAFFDCPYLESVIFEDDPSVSPESVDFRENFGNNKAFAQCRVLKSIKLSNKITYIPAYFAADCPALETVDWPSCLTQIGAGAFSNDTSLVSSDLSGTALTAIGNNAFEGCSSLPVTVFPDTLSTIGNSSFLRAALGSNKKAGDLVIPASVVEIGYYAFSQCAYLGSVAFIDATEPEVKPMTMYTSWGNGDQFSKNPFLKSIRLSNRFRALSDTFALENPKLTTVEWPKELKVIGDSAFKNDVLLTSSDLSATSLETIEAGAFSGCKALPLVKLPDTLITVGNNAFEETSMASGSAPGNLVIPASVDTMGFFAFHKCSDLGTVTFKDYTGDGIPNAIGFGTSWGSGKQFAECPKLTQISLSNKIKIVPDYFACENPNLVTVIWPQELEKINAGAFAQDPKLVSSDFSKTSLTFIGREVFAFCTSLPSPKFPADSLTEIGRGAFTDCSLSSELFIPASVEHIDANAFYKSTDLVTVEFEADNGYLNPMDLGSNIFSESVKLTTIKLSDRVEVIPAAFAHNCNTLSYITIPDRITSIGSGAFATDTYKLKKPKQTVLTSTNPVATGYNWEKDNRKLVSKITDDIGSGSGGKVDKPVQEKDYTPEAVKLGGVSINSPTSVLSIGETTEWTVKLLPEGITNADIQIKYVPDIDGVDVAKFIESNGTDGSRIIDITAVNPGSVMITATAVSEDQTYVAHELLTVRAASSDVANIASDNEEKEEKETQQKDSTKGLWIAGIDPDGYSYTGAQVKPDIRVYYGDDLLRAGTDYTVKYTNNKMVTDDAVITVTGKGMYAKSHSESFKIVKCDLSRSNPLVSASAYSSPNGLKVSVSVAGKALKAGKDYAVIDNGDGTAAITGNGTLYTNGQTVKILESSAAAIKSITVTLPKSLEYTGSRITLGDKLVLTDKGGAVDDSKYEVEYENNQNIGTATVYITGIIGEDGSGYYGTVKKSFKITPGKLTNANTSVKIPDTVVYTKGGAKVTPVIEWTSPDNKIWTLREGVDYSLNYKNNTASGNTASVFIKGIGCFKGSNLGPIHYSVINGNIGTLNGFSPDVKYDSKKSGKYYMSAPKIYDSDGKILVLNKDYKVNYVNVTKGKYIGNKSKANKGDILRVLVTGINNYKESSMTIDYRVVEQPKNLAKATASKMAPIEYTGSECIPDKMPDITVNNAPVVNGDNGYQVIKYYNNVNKGTASVLIAGTGEYSGSKLITYKITPAQWK